MLTVQISNLFCLTLGCRDLVKSGPVWLKCTGQREAYLRFGMRSRYVLPGVTLLSSEEDCDYSSTQEQKTEKSKQCTCVHERVDLSNAANQASPGDKVTSENRIHCIAVLGLTNCPS